MPARRSSSKRRKVCAKHHSYCTLKGLKAHLHAKSHAAIKRLASMHRVSHHSKTGLVRTKKTLIGILMKRKKRSIARLLGITLITSKQRSMGRSSSGRRSSRGSRKSRKSRKSRRSH